MKNSIYIYGLPLSFPTSFFLSKLITFLLFPLTFLPLYLLYFLPSTSLRWIFQTPPFNRLWNPSIIPTFSLVFLPFFPFSFFFSFFPLFFILILYLFRTMPSFLFLQWKISNNRIQISLILDPFSR